jgi:hypothetical protein
MPPVSGGRFALWLLTVAAKGRYRYSTLMLLRREMVAFLVLVLALTIFLGKNKQIAPSERTPPSPPNPIVDIWINRMQGVFFVFLPDNTARLYESYTFDLDSVGRWKSVADRTIYPESPKIALPSYQAEFEDHRVVEIFLYPIFHHDSLVVEDKLIGHRGYNRLSDTDDPNGFYRQKFARGLPQDLSIVNGYWGFYHGRPSH